jgi:rhodanese-related sulfurtransferase
MLTADLAEAPAYSPKDAEINRSGARELSELPAPSQLSAVQVQALGNNGAVLLDVRPAAEFGEGHIAGSINIGLGGQFASWAGSLIPITSDIVIIGETSAQVDESVVRLARVGIENVKGFLVGPPDAWVRQGLKLETIEQLSVAELNERIARGDLQVIDVRRPAEFSGGHVPGAYAAPLSGIEKQIASIPLKKDSETAVICAGGYRSSAAASLLQKHGFTNLMNVTGGTSAWVNAGYSVEQ